MKRSISMALAMAACAWLVAYQAGAAALSASRDTPSRAGVEMNIGVYTNTRIFAGAMVAVNSSGYAVPAANTASYIVIGRAQETVDNRTNVDGAGDSGAKTIDVSRGVFGWSNNAGITDADIGSFAYAEDDNSVDDDAPSEAIIAGIIVDVDADYVWVDTYHVGRTAGSYTTVSASGKATFNGETEMNEDVDVNLDAADEEIAITQTGVAGPGSAGLVVIDDDRTGATADTADEATITIDAEGVYGLGINDGSAYVQDDVVIGDDLTVGGDMALTGALNRDIVLVGTNATYAILAANSGKDHLIPDLTVDTTLTLPAEADHLYYRLVYIGGAADAQDWLINSEADVNYFIGGAVQHDPDNGGDDTVLFYSDGNSNSKLTVLTPESGTIIELWCDGTNWRLSGTVISATDTGVVFADQ